MWVKVTKSWVHSVSKLLHFSKNVWAASDPPGNRTFAGIESKVLGHKVKVDATLGEHRFCSTKRIPLCFPKKTDFSRGIEKTKRTKGKTWDITGFKMVLCIFFYVYFFLVGGGVVCVFIFVFFFVGGPWALILCRFELDSHWCKAWKLENDIPYGQSIWHGPQNIG